jgi:hypothetical protein
MDAVPAALQARREIMTRRRASAADIRQWFREDVIELDSPTAIVAAEIAP